MKWFKEEEIHSSRGRLSEKSDMWRLDMRGGSTVFWEIIYEIQWTLLFFSLGYLLIMITIELSGQPHIGFVFP